MNMRPSTTSKTAPRDARELVGKHDRQHIVMQPLLATSIQGLSPWPFHLFGFHLHKRDPCCKYGTPRLQPDMRNAGLTGVSRRKSTEIGLNSSGCHGVVNLHARPNQKAFL